MAIFALCYGLGLRAGEACGLRLGDVDAGRSLLIVRGGKFGKHRLVPHGPRIAALVAEQAARRARAGAIDAQAPLFTFDGRRPVHPGTASQAFHHLVAALGAAGPRRGLARHGCMTSDIRSRSGACFAGTGKGWTPRPGCASCRPSWATSSRARHRST